MFIENIIKCELKLIKCIICTLKRARQATQRIQMTATSLSTYNWENIILICGYLFNIEEALIHNPSSERGPRGS